MCPRCLNNFGIVLRSLAITAPKRVAAFPELTSAAEAGLPGYEVSTWSGLFAPKDMPPEVVQRMAKESTLASVQSGCCRNPKRRLTSRCRARRSV
ncbi:tripartite tricarboxylate transporter substrate-binding protein [Bradyrhizobium sp. AUGA SZCCT0283]|uniref:tripartite tricarboxylate transporter substrate-binding protein n=1 Tax=Bradyrhizobium sp. AUGA SZCCT0283 TaxID=2807671 RepID=UPI001BA72F41|nr:tripartite tricarboxylate transporter substrate-binding protein [Bradyrhizobium sp. AUGA SZCCT0283]MBR1276395.1 hypothetical protein [Bradyrhizobium sp. AUGA SZCCT0283]